MNRDQKPGKEYAKHISMELTADGARVTNLSLEGNRLVLTIEAELADSHLRSSDAVVREPEPAPPAPGASEFPRTRDDTEVVRHPNGGGSADAPILGLANPLDAAPGILTMGSETLPPVSAAYAPGPLDIGPEPLFEPDESAIGSALFSQPQVQPADLALPPPLPLPHCFTGNDTQELSMEATAKFSDGTDTISLDPADAIADAEEEAGEAGIPAAATATDTDTRDIKDLKYSTDTWDTSALSTPPPLPEHAPMAAASSSGATDETDRRPPVLPVEYYDEPTVPPPLDRIADGVDDARQPGPAILGESAAPMAEGGMEPPAVEPWKAPEFSDADEVPPIPPPPVEEPRTMRVLPPMEAPERIPERIDDPLALSEESSAIGGVRHGEPQPSISFDQDEAEERPAVETPTPAPEPVPEPKPEPEQPPKPPEIKKPEEPKPEEPKPEGGTTVLIRYTCPKCKTQGMQAVDKVGTVVNCSNCGKAMRLVMKK